MIIFIITPHSNVKKERRGWTPLLSIN
jgi:hypothetical protein